jgi:hypothetical protein
LNRLQRLFEQRKKKGKCTRIRKTIQDDRDPLAAARQNAELLLEHTLSKAAETTTIDDLIEGTVGPLSDRCDAAALVFATLR